MTLEEIKKIFTEETAEECARDIANLIETKSTNANLEVDFKLKKGKMVGNFNSPNTWFQADADPGTKLFQVKNVIGQIFDTDFDEKDSEQKQQSELQTEAVESFLESVRMNMNSGTYHDKIKDTIRKIVFNNVPSSLVPINVLNFLDIEINEANKNEYLISIKKLPKIDSSNGQFVEPPNSVAEELFTIHNETGKSFEEIIEMKKAEKDPKYEAVAGVEKKRYAFEIHCRIAADYSFCELPEDVVKS